jgi:hypothetical protein
MERNGRDVEINCVWNEGEGVRDLHIDYVISLSPSKKTKKSHTGNQPTGL